MYREGRTRLCRWRSLGYVDAMAARVFLSRCARSSGRDVPDSIGVFQSRSGRDDVADSICVFESRQTNGGTDSIWREDSLQRRKRRQRDHAAHGIDAGKPAATVCQSKSQLPNMPRGASQMSSLLKWQTRLQNRWRSNFYLFAK